jgi:peptide-methionine (R)-S-oxide reductase
MKWLGALLISTALFASACEHSTIAEASEKVPSRSYAVTKTDEDWKKQLSPEQYRIMRQAGTERAFTGKYWDHHEAGVYRCGACGQELFASDTKFNSGTGWPSFYQPVKKELVEEISDKTHGMERVEARCSNCGAHLGHVFDDGPNPTGLRYCINSASLDFAPKK